MGNRPDTKITEQQVLNQGQDSDYGTLASQDYVEEGSSAVRVTGATLGSQVAKDVRILDGSGNHITSFGGGTQYTEGDTDATITGTVTMWEDAANTLVPVSSAKPLPVSASIDTTGLATDATDTNTATIAGDTTSIDGKTPALGQALAAASVPVVLPAAQITTLTPPAAITGFATEAKQDTIIGHVDGIEGLLTTIDTVLDAIDAGKLEETTFTGRMGEVQASPTANTLLGRLKSLEDKIDALQTELEQKYEGTAITANLGTIADVATQTTLALIKAKTDNLDTALSTILTELQEKYEGGAITANLSATDNAVLDTIDAVLDTINAKLVSGTDIGDVTINNTGATPYKLISAASTNATSVQGSASTLYGVQVYNTNAAARYLKIYNKASAPTVGTDTPVKVITIPGNAAGSGSNITFGMRGIALGTGLAFALTTGAADSDTGAVAASEIVVNLDYI